MYDKGVRNLQLELPNLNEVITPCFLAKKTKFTLEQANKNRGVASTRYIIEVVYARVKSWKMLKNVVRYTDFSILNVSFFPTHTCHAYT